MRANCCARPCRQHTDSDITQLRDEELTISSARIDTFVRNRLPPVELQPMYRSDLPALQFPPRLNYATELLDRRIEVGEDDCPCIQAPNIR